MLFFVIILLGIYVEINNKQQMQVSAEAEVKKQYENTNASTEELYQETLANQDNHYITIKEVEELLNQKILLLYPVGCIYISESDVNPGDFIGGTWEYYGQGKTLVGSGIVPEGEFRRVFEAGATGGEYTHTLTLEEMPTHSHKIQTTAGRGSPSGTLPETLPSLAIGPNSGRNTFTNVPSIVASGGNAAHNNMQPYIVVNMWKRIQ